MKNLSCLLFVAILFVLLMTFSGCGLLPEFGCEDSDARCEPDPVTFDVEAGLADAFEEAIGRLATASGRDDLAIASGGLPVFFEEGLEAANDKGVVGPVCGLTIVYFWEGLGADRFPQTLAVNSTPPDGCRPTPAVILHELIHALSTGTHSETGLFQVQGGNGVLDEGSLEALCSGFECLRFQPETP